MINRKRSFVIAALALVALVALASPDHRADIRILAHNPGDLTPQRAQAVVDIGLASVSVLVTWSKRLGY
jgi:precorrin-6B methylase 2